jgi:hypothetical protein
MLLRDLRTEISMRDFSSKEDAPGTDLVWVRGGIDHAIFCCLRSEMLTLFRNAVRMLPERELLVVALCYCDNLGDIEIRLALDIAESTLTRLRSSADLHLSARLFGSFDIDHYSSSTVRPVDTWFNCSSTQSKEVANVYMSASQSGWLPTGHPWESVGLDVNYGYHARTWLLLDRNAELKLVQKKEKYDISAESSR